MRPGANDAMRVQATRTTIPPASAGRPRPPKLPWCATKVVKASTELTAAQKLTWIEHRALDNGPDGCFIGAGALAARLGCSRHTIEVHRRRFVAADLLIQHSQGPGFTDKWFPTLPPSCTPTTTRLSDD